LAAGGVGVEPGDGAADAFSEGDFGVVGGDEALDFGVVEDDAGGLVAGEAAELIGMAGDEEVRGYVDEVGLDTRGFGGDAVDLVPGEDLVAGDVECVAGGLPIRR
jgi:hypothetical protein